MSNVRVIFTSTLSSSRLMARLALQYATTGNTITTVDHQYGTGAALQAARDGLGDVVFGHSRVDEFIFKGENFAKLRKWVCYNYFILVGPASSSPLGANLKDSLAAIDAAPTGSLFFVSRGSDGRAGTWIREQQIWSKLGLAFPHNVVSATENGATSTLQDTLNRVLGSQQAYTLTDLGSWYYFLANVADASNLKILTPGDSTDAFASNQYAVMPVNDPATTQACFATGAAVDTGAANDFITWLTSTAGQNVINTYGTELNATKPGFVANAAPNNEVFPGDKCLIREIR